MGATSVTGVSGFGAADGNKGPGSGRQQFVPLRSPHIVAAGLATLDSGSIVVTFPTALPGTSGHYVVLLTSTTNFVSYVGTLVDDSLNDTFVSFEINGNGTDDVYWAVCTAGNA
jgi:hypothetical protein